MTATTTAHAPGDLTAAQWAGHLGLLKARRTPDDHPAVLQAWAAISWHRCKRLFDAEVQRGSMSADRAAAVLDRLAQP